VSWKDYGACAEGRAPGVDFFPDPRQGRWASLPARAVCAGCFVRAQCLDEALRGEELGIWGGTNESERKLIKGRYLKPRKALAVRVRAQ
jgi:WhiB family transcriptional regulator, redox-sensing transcriptional regulator